MTSSPSASVAFILITVVPTATVSETVTWTALLNCGQNSLRITLIVRVPVLDFRGVCRYAALTTNYQTEQCIELHKYV